MTDDRVYGTPEPGCGSGVTSPSSTGAVSRPAGGGDPTQEVGPDAAAGAVAPVAAAVDGAREHEAAPQAAEEPAGAAAARDLETLAAEIAELTEKAAKADDYLALAQRTQADFENYRKRAMREAKVAQERGALKLVESLLPAIDNLERALAHMESAHEAPSNGTAVLVAGIKHVHTDVIAALGRVGVEPFDPVGEPFDPQYHEAVAQQPVEGAQPGTVVEVFQRGYRSGENVVRPARVVVAG